MRLRIAVAVFFCAASSSEQRAIAAPSDAMLAPLLARIAEGTADRERYFSDLDAMRAAEAQKNGPASASMRSLADRELAALEAARAGALELVRKTYVDAQGQSLIDPSVRAGDVVIADAKSRTRFATHHVEWAPRYSAFGVGANPDRGAFERAVAAAATGPARARVTASGEVLVDEAIFARPPSEIAAALVHASVHFESLVTRRLCVRGGPSASAADEDELRALDAEMDQAVALGLDDAAVDLRHRQRLALEADRAHRRAEPGTATREGDAASAAGALPARDAALIDAAQCGARPAAVVEPAPAPAVASAPTRYFFDVLAGASLGLWAFDWYDGVPLTPPPRGVIGIDAGYRISTRVSLLLTLQTHLNDTGAVLNAGLGLQYELPIIGPRFALAIRLLAGFAAALPYSDNTSVAYGGFLMPEVGLRYQVSDRLHIALYPVSVPLFLADIETSLSWRVIGLVGFDF